MNNHVQLSKAQFGTVQFFVEFLNVAVFLPYPGYMARTDSFIKGKYTLEEMGGGGVSRTNLGKAYQSPFNTHIYVFTKKSFSLLFIQTKYYQQL